MPRVPPPEHTRFQKGKCYNPGGRPKYWLTSEVLRDKISKILSLTLDQVQKSLEDPKTLAIDAVLAAVVMRAVKDGDIAKMEHLFNRTLGKVKEELPLPLNDLSTMSMSQLEKMVKETLKENEDGIQSH